MWRCWGLGAGNLAEIVSHYAKLVSSRGGGETLLAPLPVRIVPINAGVSYNAGVLRPLTLKGSLSLGDRYCLALARREGLAALVEHCSSCLRHTGIDQMNWSIGVLIEQREPTTVSA